MDYPFTDQFDRQLLLETMMGPNAMLIAEELSAYMQPLQGKTVLDLGCGNGISSVLLAQKHKAKVFAADLWISPTENFSRFSALGLEDQIIPLSVDATAQLPFSHNYFDALFSIDAYHYFGCNETMLSALLPFVKKGGQIAIAVPGLKEEFRDGIPSELKPFLPPDANFHSLEWWTDLWSKETGVRLENCREMDCCKRAWDDWLASPNPYAVGDIPMMEAEAGKYFNFVQLVARVL
ncbi:methyltransferase domain-containing protein [Microvirga sp. W0021]|uniref:Methyltransferase domain-containing protein n=1 Tax=Hohaiivirga grylli TaxID=3133970 RepID=A0ABV0BM22_9HYPH